MGSFENGRDVYIAMNSNGYYVSASVYMTNPDQNFSAQGTCSEYNGQANFSITLNNGVMETGQIYLASDGQTYVEGTQNYDNQRFVLQRQ